MGKAHIAIYIPQLCGRSGDSLSWGSHTLEAGVARAVLWEQWASVSQGGPSAKPPGRHRRASALPSEPEPQT